MRASRSLPGIGLLLISVGSAVIAGCSNEPAPPPRFKIDPESAAQEAMTLYDKDGDGRLDRKELEASPPLRDLLENLKAADHSHADSLSKEDIAARLEEWRKATATLLTVVATVYLDGKPVEGAAVTFEPETFLGASYHTHRGQTNIAGVAALDPELKGYPGIYVGLYRVRISKMVDGKETLPERYNTHTELGREFANNVRDMRGNGLFSLKSK